MSVIIENNFSNHAIKRSQQRGIRPWVVNFILEYSDKYKHANESCISQFISKRKVKKLIQTFKFLKFSFNILNFFEKIFLLLGALRLEGGIRARK